MVTMLGPTLSDIMVIINVYFHEQINTHTRFFNETFICLYIFLSYRTRIVL